MEELLRQYLNPYYVQVITLMGIMMIAALGLHLITGATGQLSFGHAAFLAIGAYAAALSTIHLELPFLVSVLLGGIIAALAGVIVGFPSMRLTGDYLGIATLGFAEIVRVVLMNLEITGGARGLAGIPRETSMLLVFICVAITVFVCYRIENSRFGRALVAIREDEIAAECNGINTLWYKVSAFAIGSFMAGVAGGLYAHFLQYLNPSGFGFAKSFELLCFVVLGGLGSIPGAVLGTTILTLLPEMLRFSSEYRMMMYGVLMVSMMIFRPRGLLGGVDLLPMLKAIIPRRRQPAAESKNGNGRSM